MLYLDYFTAFWQGLLKSQNVFHTKRRYYYLYSMSLDYSSNILEISACLTQWWVYPKKVCLRSSLKFRTSSQDPTAQTKSNWKWAVGTLIRRSSASVLAVLNTNETQSVGSRTNGSFKLWPGLMVSKGMMVARSFAFFPPFSELSLADPGILWLENPAGCASPVGLQRLDRTKSQGMR